jgi:uncharacterized protein (TIGR04255 family)
MTNEQTYSNAPITEAIIDLRVVQRDGLTLAELERCQAGEEKAYPNKWLLNMFEGRIQFGGAEEPSSYKESKEQTGFGFKSADGKHVVEVHRDGFVFHRLAPYAGWEQFRKEARRLWNVYQHCVRPGAVVRVALRYINRIDLPMGAELKDYLRTSPEVSPDLPQRLDGFFMQVNIPNYDIKSNLLLREMAVPSANPDRSSVILDIDLFRTEEIPVEDGAMWEVVESLRVRKNEIFEACITKQTREVIR